MTLHDKIKRRVRSALRLSSDPRAPKGEAKAAKRMAEKLMAKHGWTLGDLRDGTNGEDLPGDKLARIRIPHGGNADRHMVVGAICMARFPTVHHFSCWCSLLSPAQAVEFRAGKDNHLAEACSTWNNLNREIRETWAITQKFRTFSFMRPGGQRPTDEFSWLMGIRDGYLRMDGEFKKRQEAAARIIDSIQNKTLLSAPDAPSEPKKRRRRLPRKNAFALAPLDPRLQPGYRPPAFEPPIAGDEPEPEKKPTREIDPASYRSGVTYGGELAKRFEA